MNVFLRNSGLTVEHDQESSEFQISESIQALRLSEFVQDW